MRAGPAPFLEALARHAEAGFDHVGLHQVGPDQEGCLDVCARELVPRVGAGADARGLSARPRRGRGVGGAQAVGAGAARERGGAGPPSRRRTPTSQRTAPRWTRRPTISP